MTSIPNPVGFVSTVCLAANLFLISPLAIGAADYADLPASAGAISALIVGEQAPSFTVRLKAEDLLLAAEQVAGN